MKLRTTALVMALAMSVSLLSACGSKSDASSPAASSPAVSQPADMPQVQSALSLNKSAISLFSAGESYQLKAEVTGTEEPVIWSSADEAVAAVAEDGTVTAVAPGSAVITAICGPMTAQCEVTCDFVVEDEAPEVETPAQPEQPSETPEAETPVQPEQPAETPEAETPAQPEQPAETPEASAPSATVDLNAFYADIMASGGENSPAMMEVFGEYLDGFYPGLSAIATNQCVVYTPMISAVACEVAMIECANAADVETVRSILQARVDNQVAGGAWYPDTIAGWENNSKIVVKGNYVALFVIPEGLMDAAAAFNDLF